MLKNIQMPDKLMKLSCDLLSTGDWIFQGVVLLMRLKMAEIFFQSGLNKIGLTFNWFADGALIANPTFAEGAWDSTIMLFTYEHPVPFLPTELAAYSGTFLELVCPILLTFGIFTRFGAMPMLFMTAVIEFTYKSYDIHAFWALLLAAIIAYGPGKFSLDYLIVRECCPVRGKNSKKSTTKNTGKNVKKKRERKKK